MMRAGGSYTRNSNTHRVAQPVSIVSVDTTSPMPTATGITRTREYIHIDIGYYVGAIKVTPNVGEQWIVIKEQGTWKLESQLPFNLQASLEVPVPGQTRVGSSGPTELDGSQVNINAPVRPLAVATGERPDASSVPTGSNIFDTTLNKPLWSDGTQWRDAAGSVA